MFFQAVYFGHFLSFYTMQLEPPKPNVESWPIAKHNAKDSPIHGPWGRMIRGEGVVGLHLILSWAAKVPLQNCVLGTTEHRIERWKCCHHAHCTCPMVIA